MNNIPSVQIKQTYQLWHYPLICAIILMGLASYDLTFDLKDNSLQGKCSPENVLFGSIGFTATFQRLTRMTALMGGTDS